MTIASYFICATGMFLLAVASALRREYDFTVVWMVGGTTWLLRAIWIMGQR